MDKTRKKEYVISISYGNFLIQNGGTDKVIREHLELMNENDITYIFIFPVVKKISILGKNEIRFWGLNIDENFRGIFNIKGILSEVCKFECQNYICRGIFIHHLWRVDLKDIHVLLGAYDTKILIYLHDMYSVCEQQNMIRQDNRYCGYGLLYTKCHNGCEYRNGAIERRKVFGELLNAYSEKIICIAPSPSVKKIYDGTFTKYQDRIKVIPHQKIEGQYNEIKKHDDFGIIKIGFVGTQSINKGWHVFEKLVSIYKNYEKYQFYYLGNGKKHLECVVNIDVSVQRDGKNAMIKALRKNNIDIALLLSVWPETYSYTYYESYVSGCYILAMQNSGNISDMIEKNNNGRVFSKQSELVEYFRDISDVRSDVLRFSNNIEIPLILKPNNEILDELCYGYFTRNFMKDSAKYRLGILDILYRIINRGKLNAYKNNE